MVHSALGQHTAAAHMLSPRAYAARPQRCLWLSSRAAPFSVASAGQRADVCSWARAHQAHCQYLRRYPAQTASCRQEMAGQANSSEPVWWCSAARLQAYVFMLMFALAFADPSAAELQTVTASDAVAAARPLVAKPVRKDKVWLLLAGGAAALFGGTVLIENNEQFFPAIARANQAIARSREQQQNEQKRRQGIEAERKENARLLSALEDGLQTATDRQAAASSRSEGASEAARSSQLSSVGARPELASSTDRAKAQVVHERPADNHVKARNED